jgi:hypothetical protein
MEKIEEVIALMTSMGETPQKEILRYVRGISDGISLADRRTLVSADPNQKLKKTGEPA